jgi:hypothetical protein
MVTWEVMIVATSKTAGGDVDIALVTSYAGFKWIERKRISELLEE